MLAVLFNTLTFDFVNTYIIAITNQRIMLATKRIVFGYFFKSISFDLSSSILVLFLEFSPSPSFKEVFLVASFIALI